jgi:TatD DNase family protein
MCLVDTHCHLDFSHFDSDRDLVIQRAWDAGLSTILIPGVDIKSSRAAIQLATRSSGIFAAVGIHPNSSGNWYQGSETALKNLAENINVVAIGEIGLDYYRDRAPKVQQKAVFLKQLGLAKNLGLPVIIHTRNAKHNDRSCISDLITILTNWKTDLEYPGVIHSYSGNVTEAFQLISLGYFLGITGPVSYPKADELRKVVAAVPLEKLLIETDSPFLTPQPRRGKRNEPSFVRFIAERLAIIRAQPVDEIIMQTEINAGKLFRWGKID